MSGDDFLRARHVHRGVTALGVELPLDLHGVQFVDPAVGIADKFFCRGAIDPWVGAIEGGGFFLPVVHAVNLRPFGPRVVRGTGRRRLGQNFQLDHALAPVADGGADAIGAGVAAADDHDVTVFGREMRGDFRAVEETLGVRAEEFHGRINSVKVAAIDREITRLGGAAAKHDSIEILAEFFNRIALSDIGVGHELDAFGREDINPALDDVVLVQLHVGNAVSEEAADAVGALEDGDQMSGFVQLVRAG